MNNDTPEVIPGRVAIVSPSGEVLNKGVKPAKYDASGKRAIPKADFLKGLVNREEVIHHMTTAALEVGQKIYDQLSGETAEHLEQMEHLITQRVLAEIERRSVRGRIQTRWLIAREWAHGYLVEFGVVSPIAAKPEVKLVEERKGDGPEGSHSCPACGEWCVCAEWYDGDPCRHRQNVGCSVGANITVEMVDEKP